MSPALSYRIYVSCTPGKLQPARRQMDEADGPAVEQLETYVAEPFRVEWHPKSSGNNPNLSNSDLSDSNNLLNACLSK